MYKLLTKNGQLFAFLVGIIGTAIILGSIMGNSNKYMLEADDAAKRATDIANTGILDAAATITMILLFVAIAATLIFAVMHLATNFKSSLTWIVALAALIGLFFIFKNTSSTEASGTIVETMRKFNVSDSLGNGISGAIKITGLMLVVAIVSMLVMEVLNFFK